MLCLARSAGWVALGLVFLGGQAFAAYPTRVLTAAEKDNPIDVDLSVTSDTRRKTAKVVREWVQEEGGTVRALDVKELRFQEHERRLLLGLRIGVFHDLEFHLLAPIHLENESSIAFGEGVEGRSTVCCAGDPNADDATAGPPPRYPLTEVPASRERSGFGDMTFGLAWSPFVDLKDEAYPTLTLSADITAPTGGDRNPADVASVAGGGGGGVGRGMTVFDLSIAASRRMRLGTPALDPYVIVAAEIPIATGKQKDRGMEPPPAGRFTIGTELVVYEEKGYFESAFDFSFTTRYVGPGRTYGELSDYLPSFDPTKVLGNRPEGSTVRPDDFVYSDFSNPANYRNGAAGASCGALAGVPCGELNRTDEHLQLRGQAAAQMRIMRYGFIRAGLMVEHDTDHFLTNERVGSDRDPASAATLECDGADCVGRVNARNSFFDRERNVCPAGQTCDERNPHYDPRYDALGRRLRIEETFTWLVFVMVAATF